MTYREEGRSEYRALHVKIRAALGPASVHECTDCYQQASEWSLIDSRDPQDPNNYEPRCRPCHLDYDKDKQRTGPNRKETCKYGHNVTKWGRDPIAGVCNVCRRIRHRANACQTCGYSQCRCN